MARLKNQAASGCPKHCDAVATSLFLDLTIDLRPRHNHFGDVVSDAINADATMPKQISLVRLPHMNHSKPAVDPVMSPYTKINFAAGQTELWHLGNRAETEPASRV